MIAESSPRGQQADVLVGFLRQMIAMAFGKYLIIGFSIVLLLTLVLSLVAQVFTP